MAEQDEGEIAWEATMSALTEYRRLIVLLIGLAGAFWFLVGSQTAGWSRARVLARKEVKAYIESKNAKGEYLVDKATDKATIADLEKQIEDISKDFQDLNFDSPIFGLKLLEADSRFAIVAAAIGLVYWLTLCQRKVRAGVSQISLHKGRQMALAMGRFHLSPSASELNITGRGMLAGVLVSLAVAAVLRFLFEAGGFYIIYRGNGLGSHAFTPAYTTLIGGRLLVEIALDFFLVLMVAKCLRSNRSLEAEFVKLRTRGGSGYPPNPYEAPGCQ